MACPPRARAFPELVCLLILLLCITCLRTSAGQSTNWYHLPTRSSLEHVYSVAVSASYDNLTTHFEGVQVLRLQNLNQDALVGHLTWNLSWDEGETWRAINATYTYGADRTYRIQDVALFTAWWVDPEIQLGQRIPIHGDSPATDYFPRSGPFLATDLVSLTLKSGRYTCWLLAYETIDGQREYFYYERWTGLLVAAYSGQDNPPLQSRQVQLELQTANPLLPSEDLLTHLWLTYGSTLLSLGLALLAATGTHRLLLRVREHRFNEWLSKEPEQNA